MKSSDYKKCLKTGLLLKYKGKVISCDLKLKYTCTLVFTGFAEKFIPSEEVDIEILEDEKISISSEFKDFMKTWNPEYPDWENYPWVLNYNFKEG